MVWIAVVRPHFHHTIRSFLFIAKAFLNSRHSREFSVNKKAPAMPERAWLVLLFALSCKCEKKTVINAEPV